MRLNPLIHPAIITIIALLLLLALFYQYRNKRERVNLVLFTRILQAILITILLLSPSIPGAKTPAGALNLDILFVVDTTTSMAAEDYKGQETERLVGVRQDIIDISEKFSGARFGLITFDSAARIEMPMTTDRGTLVSVTKSFVRELSPKSKGSSIDIPLDLIKKQIEKNKKKNPQRPNIVIYMGDGEQTAKSTPKSFDALKSLVDGGAVLGYGTSEGGKMKIYYGYGSYGDQNSISGEYVVDLTAYNQNGDYEFPVAISKIDETALNKIAGEMGVKYIGRNNGGNVSEIAPIKDVQSIADNTRQITGYTSLNFLMAVPLVALIFIDTYWIYRQGKPFLKKARGTSK